MVRSHTYFIARRSQCEGALKSNEDLAAGLAALYEQHKGAADVTVVDGSSAWIDEAGATQWRVIAGGVAQVVAAPAALTALFEKASAA
jgi:hypothetical protein